jgi:hypothetical protein
LGKRLDFFVEQLDGENDNVALIARRSNKVVVLIVAKTKSKVAFVLERWRDGNVAAIEGFGHGDTSLAEFELSACEQNRALLELVAVAHQDFEHESVECQVRFDLSSNLGIELDLDGIGVDNRSGDYTIGTHWCETHAALAAWV